VRISRARADSRSCTDRRFVEAHWKGLNTSRVYEPILNPQQIAALENVTGVLVRSMAIRSDFDSALKRFG